MTTKAQAAATARPTLAELWTLRTDFESVPVPMLGDHELRVYALTGTARAHLMAEMSGLADQLDTDMEQDPATVRKVLEFQGRVVAASLGYPEPEWDAVGATIGAQAVELLYDVAARLSGLDKAEQKKAAERLPPTRKAGSGTG